MTTPLWTIAPGAVPAVIDISDNNRHLDSLAEFQALKAAGVQLVIHKASQGVKEVDPLYAKRRPLAIEAGLRWDAYHFCTSAPIAAQQAHFLAVAQRDAGMRLMVDAELNPGATIKPVDAAAFACNLDQALGRQVLGYGGAGFADYMIPGWHDRPLMWAKYGPEPTVELLAKLGVPPANVVIWQKTGTGTVAGFKPIDLSYYRYQAAGALDMWPLIPGFDGVPLPAAA